MISDAFIDIRSIFGAPLHFIIEKSEKAIMTIIPGINPAKNNLLTETPTIIAYIIIGILGGMMIPITEEIAVTLAAFSFEYPPLIIMGISRGPRAAVSATAAPDIPAKNIEATTLI